MNLRPLHGNPLLEERNRLGPLAPDHPARRHLVRRYAYGIPTEDILEAIGSASPGGVVELGAGTGYWARLLHDRGVDVVALDLAPPPDGTNRFVDDGEPWFQVRRGDADAVVDHADRTLLLVWPTWNETWAGDAAALFHAAGGQTLVYVGDGPGGVTGDPALHARLGLQGACLSCTLGVVGAPCVCSIELMWELTAALPLPGWGGADDDGRIFRRRADAPPPARWWRAGGTRTGRRTIA